MSSKAKEDPSRREFLRCAACAAVGTTAISSTIFDLRLIKSAAAASVVSDYKALVCLFLFGGNDANNLIVPTAADDYNDYATARQNLAIPLANLLPLSPAVGDGRTYGLHPSCTGLQTLFNSGKLALLCNVGTLIGPVTRATYLNRTAALPPQLFSHNDQQVQWQTSVPDQPARTGWGGRAADMLYANNTSNVSMNISLAGTNIFEVGTSVNPYNVGTNGSVGLANLSASRLQAVRDIIALPHDNLYEKSFAQITDTAIENNALLSSALASAPPITTVFPATSLGNQMRMIARLISARAALGHKRQIFFCSVGGYDLHGAQLTAHANLFTELSGSMKAFYDATVELGVSNNVTTFTASDFGRTLPSNGLGSDHGWGSHQMVMGGAVQGQRMYGTFPTLVVNGPDDTGTGRWIPTTAVDEYSATLARWFGVSNADMPTVFPNLSRFARPDLGFML